MSGSRTPRTDDHLRHGTIDAYRNHECRCPVCVRFNTDYVREYLAARAKNGPSCSVEVCDRGVYARGLCRAHYERQRTGKPIDTPVRPYPDSGRGPQPGKRRARP